MNSKSIISFLLLAAAILIFVVWSRPLMAEVDSLKSYKQTLEDTLSQTRELQVLRDDLLAKYNSITSDNLDRLAKIIPNRDEVAKLLVELSDIAVERGVVMKSVDTTLPKESVNQIKTQEYNALTFETQLLASYAGFRSFLEEMQKNLRLVDIDEIKFEAKGFSVFDITINGKAYFK